MSHYQPDAKTKERYIQGKLNETEQVNYELWLADHPDVLKDLELDLMMQEGVITTSRAKQKAVGVHAKVNDLSWLKPIAWAASLLLVVLSAVLVKTQFFTRSDNADWLVKPITYQLSTMRSADPGVVTVKRNETALLQIMVSDSLYETASYSIEVMQNNQHVKILSNEQATNGMVLLVLLPNFLEVGEYQLILTKSGGDMKIQYSIEVVNQ